MSTANTLNEVHLVSYSEDANRIDTDLAFGLHNETGNLHGYEVSHVSSSPYDRGTLVVAIAPTIGGDVDDGNKVVFYQVHEKEAGTILDPLLEDNDEAKEPEDDDASGKI